MHYSNFKTRLQHLREDSDMKQSDLAQMLNMKAAAISKYEKGRAEPSIETICKLADIFNVSIDYLLGESNIKNPYVVRKISDEQYRQEQNLLVFYRQLTHDNKMRADERVRSLLDFQKESDTKK